MKRLLALALLFVPLAPFFAQQSLQSSATNGLIENPNDWVLYPNAKFTAAASDYVLAFTDFQPLEGGTSAKFVPGTFLGYHHKGTVPFTLGASFRMTGTEEITKTVRTVTGTSAAVRTETVTETQYVTPAFDSYYGTFFFLIGFPKAANLSTGIRFYINGNENIVDKYTQTVTVNGTETSRVENRGTVQKNMSLQFVIPVSYKIGSTDNNSSFGVSVNSAQTETVSETKNSSAVYFFLFHKTAFKSLIPGGTHTQIWAAGGNKEFEYDLLEPTPFSSSIQKKTMFQFGISNRYDYSFAYPVNSARPNAPALTAAFNPKLYADFIIKDRNTFDVGVTLAVDIGLNADLGTLPLAFFIGMTPRIYYREQSVKETYNQTSSSYDQYARARDFRADILWSGKIGLSIFFPKNWVCDITVNVDTATKLTGISAQLTIPTGTQRAAR